MEIKKYLWKIIGWYRNLFFETYFYYVYFIMFTKKSLVHISNKYLKNFVNIRPINNRFIQKIFQQENYLLELKKYSYVALQRSLRVKPYGSIVSLNIFQKLFEPNRKTQNLFKLIICLNIISFCKKYFTSLIIYINIFNTLFNFFAIFEQMLKLYYEKFPPRVKYFKLL